MYPDDYDITLAMSAQHMKKAEKLMELGLYAEALPHVLFVSQKQDVYKRQVYRSQFNIRFQKRVLIDNQPMVGDSGIDKRDLQIGRLLTRCV